MGDLLYGIPPGLALAAAALLGFVVLQVVLAVAGKLSFTTAVVGSGAFMTVWLSGLMVLMDPTEPVAQVWMGLRLSVVTTGVFLLAIWLRARRHDLGLFDYFRAEDDLVRRRTAARREWLREQRALGVRFPVHWSPPPEVDPRLDLVGSWRKEESEERQESEG